MPVTHRVDDGRRGEWSSFLSQATQIRIGQNKMNSPRNAATLFVQRGKQTETYSLGAAARCGIVIAAIPAMTQTRPIQTVGERVSPRNTTPSATPIGTRR